MKTQPYVSMWHNYESLFTLGQITYSISETKTASIKKNIYLVFLRKTLKSPKIKNK